MATLEKRVQVLFSQEQYAQLEVDAKAERTSVGAYIRESVELRIQRRRRDTDKALQELWEWVDRQPAEHGPPLTPEEWEAHKNDHLERPAVRDIP